MCKHVHIPIITIPYFTYFVINATLINTMLTIVTFSCKTNKHASLY